MKKSQLGVALALAACLVSGVALTGCDALSTATKGSSSQASAAITQTNGTTATAQAGDSAAAGSKTTTSAAEQTGAKAVAEGIGKVFTVSTKYGTLEVQVDGFQTDEATTAEYRATPMFGDNNTPGILMLTVKNVSYNSPNEETADTVDLTQAVQLSVNGKTPELLKSGLSYNGYESAYEGKVKCFAPGTTLKCNLAYELTDVPGEVTVTVGGAQYTLPVVAQ